jgi:integrase
MTELAKIPTNKGGQHGVVLEAEQLRSLVQGFRSSILFPIVAVAAFTGARRNEILALRWSDLDVAAKTLRIERAVEDTKTHGLRMKGPKTARGKRTITIDDDLIALLVAERERYLRIMAGVPDWRAGACRRRALRPRYRGAVVQLREDDQIGQYVGGRRDRRFDKRRTRVKTLGPIWVQGRPKLLNRSRRYSCKPLISLAPERWQSG